MPCSKNKETKLLAVASFGGHWVQLLRLKPLLNKYDTTYVSCFYNQAKDLRYMKTIDVNADSNKIKLFFALVCNLFILIKVRPQVIISTGALPGLIILIMGKKLFRAKTIWIDSIANGDELSKSGVMAQKFSDIYLTQWSHLEKPDGPSFLGSVL
jgi:UDP-N-acetylglucosamine:LPS N-acetylglucosamine transferase